jgi:uncharacterized protein
VKASPEDQAHLLTLGSIDTEVTQIRRSLATLPAKKQLADAEAERADAWEQQRVAQENVDGLQADVARAENDVALVDERIQRDQDRLQASTSAKDAQGLEHELQTLLARRSLLEDVQLELLEQSEAAQAALDAARNAVAAIDARIAAAQGEVAWETASSEATSESLMARRGELVESLPADLVALYEKQRERYGVGVSELRGVISTASGVQLTESDLHDIRQAKDDDVVLCPDSNAILVRSR